jgi:ABC-type transport system substrate-binding protein
MSGCAAPTLDGVTATDPDEVTATDGPTAVIEKLTIRLSEPVSVFDPSINSGNGANQIRLLTQGQLYRFDADGVPQPDLVESAEVSADELTWTMTLKPDLKYSDDTPLLAQDAVGVFQRSVVERVGGDGFFTPFVESVEAPDDRTVVFNLLRPYAQLPVAISMGPLGLHPDEVRKSDQNYWLNPVSAGPYFIDNFAAGDQTMRLLENPNYVGGPLMVKAIDSVVVTDITQAALQLTSGGLDFALGLPYASFETLDGIEGVEPVAHPTGGVFQLGLNPRTGPLSDVTVRQAINLAINRDEISEKAWRGFAEPNLSWIMATDPSYEPVMPNDGKQDLEEAKRLMATTPYAAGFDLTIDTFAPRDGHTASVTVLKEQLAAININVIVNPLEIPAAIARVNDSSFEGFFAGSVSPTGPAIMTITQCESGVWGRWSPTSNPRICELVLQSTGEVDPKATLTEAATLAAEAVTIIPIVNRREIFGTRVPLSIIGQVRNTPWIYVATQAEFGVTE